MQVLEIRELPQPRRGKTGWPWTEESAHLPNTVANGKAWPRISIVTPSYNQGQFIEETIRSVLLQGYPNLEYIIVDGGSTDDSVEIIRKYENNLAYWVSEPDRGQAHAINKGFKRATGEIVGWINSDDYYYPGVLQPIVQAFVEHPEIAIVHGYENHVDRNGRLINKYYPFPRDARAATLYFGHPLMQLACFWRNDAYRAIGGLDESLDYLFDYDFLLRLSYSYRSKYVHLCVGAFRRYAEQKCRPELREQFILEHNRVIEKFLTQANMSALKRQLLRYWLRGLLLWRYEGASGLLRAIASSFRAMRN